MPELCGQREGACVCDLFDHDGLGPHACACGCVWKRTWWGELVVYARPNAASLEAHERNQR